MESVKNIKKEILFDSIFQLRFLFFNTLLWRRLHYYKDMEFNKFDKVKVSPTATGLGDWLDGWIDDIYEFAGKTFVSVRYNKSTIYGD